MVMVPWSAEGATFGRKAFGRAKVYCSGVGEEAEKEDEDLSVGVEKRRPVIRSRMAAVIRVGNERAEPMVVFLETSVRESGPRCSM